MAAGRILFLLAMSALIPTMTLAQGHPAPPADVVEHLRRHHRQGDWWRITTDSARYETRVSAIDAEGLAGFETRRKTPPAPDRIGWESIVRIDLRKSHQTRGQIRGLLLGLCAGFIPLANGNANSSQPKYYTLLGGAAGFYLGGKLGAADVHEQSLYVAPLPPPAPVAPVLALSEPARSDTAAVTLPGGWARAAITSQPPRVSHSRARSLAIEKACRRISPADLLRIQGDFGTFTGYAATIGPEGLTGLRVEIARPSVASPGSLGWDRIDRLEVNGSNARRGAMGGAISFGAAGMLFGLPIGAMASDNGASMGGVVIACAAVGAGIGAVLGSAGGAMSSGWHDVYRR